MLYIIQEINEFYLPSFILVTFVSCINRFCWASAVGISNKHWAQALTEAEGIISSCIGQYLESYVQKIYFNISARVNQVLDLLIETDAKDPIKTIKSTLTRANIGRNRISKETRKYKRESKDDGPPNEKAKKWQFTHFNL